MASKGIGRTMSFSMMRLPLRTSAEAARARSSWPAAASLSSVHRSSSWRIPASKSLTRSLCSAITSFCAVTWQQP